MASTVSDKVIEKINKEFGQGSMYFARDIPSIPTVSSGSLSLDFAIGIGGLPTNRVVEFAGNEGAGKTTLALVAAANIIDQQPDRAVMFIDMEHKLTPSWIETIVGKDRMDSIVVAAPDSIEQATEMYRRFVKGGSISMVILDSIGGAPTNQAMDDTRDVSKKSASMGGNSVGVSAFARLAANLSAKYNCLTIGINQTRQDMKSQHGNMLETPGGKAWKHACVLRVEVRRGGERYSVKIGGEDVVVGFDVRAKIHKNQLGGQENRTCEWRFFTQETEQFGAFGIDQTEECIRLAMVLGVITRAGAYYRHPALPNGQVMGQPALVDLVQNDDGLRDTIVGEVMSALKDDPDRIGEVAPVEENEDDEPSSVVVGLGSAARSDFNEDDAQDALGGRSS